MKKIRVGIVFGGKSAEHEVSVQSAQSVYRAIDKTKFAVSMIRIDKQGNWESNPFNLSKKFNIIFPVMHGTYGEDGSIQGMLKMLDLPYVGPDILGSAISMDKDVTKNGKEWLSLRNY
jgi:D-alanine-D-alanine ligase